MKLIGIIRKNQDTLLKTYKGTAGNITHVLRSGNALTVANCDKMGNPRVFLDFNKNRRDIYIKAQDGSTILKQGDKITRLPNLIFNSLCDCLFK